MESLRLLGLNTSCKIEKSNSEYSKKAKEFCDKYEAINEWRKKVLKQENKTENMIKFLIEVGIFLVGQSYVYKDFFKADNESSIEEMRSLLLSLANDVEEGVKSIEVKDKSLLMFNLRSLQFMGS